MKETEKRIRLEKLTKFLKTNNSEFDFTPSSLIKEGMLELLEIVMETYLIQVKYQLSKMRKEIEGTITFLENEEYSCMSIGQLETLKQEIEDHNIILNEMAKGSARAIN